MNIMQKASGMEAMAKAFGLGPALEGVKQLVASGALEKVVQFADEIKILNERLTTNEDAIEALRADIARDNAELMRLLALIADATAKSGASTAPSGNADG